eukprot:Tbor_TRINITY_DN4987_c6_g2::TRINITY_DN4987_c6_g2_i1::g.9812::m.9812
MYRNTSILTSRFVQDNTIQTNLAHPSNVSKISLITQNEQRNVSSSIPLHGNVFMYVEGTKTGEEKIIKANPDRRSSSALKPSAPLCRRISRAQNSPGDSSRLKALEDDNMKLRSLLKAKTKENDCMKRNNEEIEEKLKEACNEVCKQSTESEKALREKDSIIADLGVRIANLREDLRNSEHLQMDSGVKMKTQKEYFESELDKVRKELAEQLQNATNKTGDASITDARVSSSNQCICCCSDLLAKIEEFSNWEEIALKAQRELRENELLMREWKERIGKCNDYVVRICQPDYCVVKDSTLVPATVPPSDGTSHAGFVLVPLKLMIEGYELLPTDTKRHIANTYEASKCATLKDRILAGRGTLPRILNNTSNLSITTISAYNLKKT